jgi:hypothetical protein
MPNTDATANLVSAVPADFAGRSEVVGMTYGPREAKEPAEVSVSKQTITLPDGVQIQVDKRLKAQAILDNDTALQSFSRDAEHPVPAAMRHAAKKGPTQTTRLGLSLGPGLIFTGKSGLGLGLALWPHYKPNAPVPEDAQNTKLDLETGQIGNVVLRGYDAGDVWLDALGDGTRALTVKYDPSRFTGPSALGGDTSTRYYAFLPDGSVEIRREGYQASYERWRNDGSKEVRERDSYVFSGNMKPSQDGFKGDVPNLGTAMVSPQGVLKWVNGDLTLQVDPDKKVVLTRAGQTKELIPYSRVDQGTSFHYGEGVTAEFRRDGQPKSLSIRYDDEIHKVTIEVIPGGRRIEFQMSR